MALSDEQIEAIFLSVDSGDKGRFAIVRLFARAIEAEARRDALEEAAKVCEAMHEEDRPVDYAYAICALKEAIK